MIEENSKTHGSKVSFFFRWSGQPMGVHSQLSREQCTMQQAQWPVDVGSRCRQKPSNIDEHMKYKLPWSEKEQQ